MSIKTALEKLNTAINDLSSLHVQTFTGKVDLTIPADAEDKMSLIETAITNDGDIKLVAESLYKFDGDSYNFLTNEEGGIPSSAMELHKSAVEGGIKTRQALAELVKGVFN